MVIWKMKSEMEIRDMKNLCKAEMKRLEIKGYKDTDTYKRNEFQEHILKWVLD